MSIGDVVDLEYRLARDQWDSSRQELNERDAAIAAEIDAGSLDDAALVMRWLDAVRAQDGQAIGRTIDTTIETARGLALGGGVLIGASIVTAWLSIESGKPINAIHFWGALVGLQIVFLLLTLTALMLPGAAKRVLLGPMRALAVAITWISSRFLRGHREAIRAVSGMTERYAKLYGRLRLWLFMQIVQFFALALNIGIIATFIALAIVSDPAFGWRSTLLSDEATHRATQIIALPWAWLVPEATLTLEDVEATRYSSLDATFIEQFRSRQAAGVWAAWWPFLLASLIVYGLLPRLVLATVSSWRLSHMLRAMPPMHGAVIELRERLRRPRIDTRGVGTEKTSPSSTANESRMVEPVHAESVLVMAWSGVTADEPTLRQWVASRLGGNVAAVHRVGGIDVAADRAALTAAKQASANTTIALVVEAWEPPVGDYLDFLQELRAVAGPTRLIAILLYSPSPVQASQIALWRSHLGALGDPWLRVLSLNTEAAA